MIRTKIRKTSNKYGAKKTAVDGIVFHSKLEATRYSQLKLLQASGEIQNLALQVKYPLKVNNVLICTYIADFTYIRRCDTAFVIEDAKAVRTAVFNIKWKFLRAIQPADVKLEIWPAKTRKVKLK